MIEKITETIELELNDSPGISQLNNTNTYRVDNSTTSDPLDMTDITAFGFALCDSGDFVINGGCNIVGPIL